MGNVFFLEYLEFFTNEIEMSLDSVNSYRILRIRRIRRILLFRVIAFWGGRKRLPHSSNKVDRVGGFGTCALSKCVIMMQLSVIRRDGRVSGRQLYLPHL